MFLCNNIINSRDRRIHMPPPPLECESSGEGEIRKYFNSICMVFFLIKIDLSKYRKKVHIS